MTTSETWHLALVGNPNTGKTALFNQLTGLKQKTGNYPGVTVDKKQGNFSLADGTKVTLTDLPGAYSLIPNASDEKVTANYLLNADLNKIDGVILVTEVTNLKRNLLLFSQVKDLKLPCVLVINMADQIRQKGISIDVAQLSKSLKTPIVLTSARSGEGLKDLRQKLQGIKAIGTSLFSDFYHRINADFFKKLQDKHGDDFYRVWLQRALLAEKEKPEMTKYLQKETIYRYQKIGNLLKDAYKIDRTKARSIGARIDKVLTHKIFGFVFFFALLMLMFQAVFTWSSVPMDFIDETFAGWAGWIAENMPKGMLNGLISEGIVAGLGGVIIFVPQIAVLTFFMAVLEEVGYMSRAVFLMDRLMRRFGMSGKSVIPLISGTACAIPAIMATRSMDSWKDRLITILVTPFTTCAARLPVYAILIALVIPEKTYWGIFNLQGLSLAGLYLLGFASAIGSAFVLQKFLKMDDRRFFIMEMPDYKMPLTKNLLIAVFQKSMAFLSGAGKIILALSIVIWFLSSNGGEAFEKAAAIVTAQNEQKANPLDEEAIEQAIASEKLSQSYMGRMGNFIEPAIRPLGYDWKIGIALLTSFAAREVFVGTLATIYGVDSEEELPIKERMAAERNSVTGGARFDLACGLSLLIFYAFAMQCMATLAIVKRETKSWKWPLLQFGAMTVLAYMGAYITRMIVLFLS